MPESNETIRLLPAQTDRAVEVLTRAFQADPMYNYFFSDPREQARSLPGLWDGLVRYTLRYGEVYTTAQVSGVACWLSPGNTDMTFWRMLRTGMRLARAFMRFPPDARRKSQAVLGYLEQVRKRLMGRRPHWYLMALGVEPARQGQGIGGQLIQPVLARADQAGLPCYLETETERNVAFYQKRGFVVAQGGPVPGHTLPLWMMVREPHP
jgi:GNAT superfamily N-acetyltransferase